MAIKRCKAAFAVMVNGAPRVVTAGQLVDDSDPIVKGREANFEDVETYVSERRERQVEQATAAPREQRTLSRPAAKKATAKRTEPRKGGGES